MYDWFFYEMLARDRESDLLREARQERLIREMETRHFFLDEDAAHFNQKPASVLRWLFQGWFPTAARLAGGWTLPREEVAAAENGRAVQRQEQIDATGAQRRLGGTPTTILHLRGPLDANSYETLIDAAREVYQAGGRNIILDMSNVPCIGSSSLVALYSVAATLNGEEPPDLTAGWGAFHALASVHAAGPGRRVKLLNPRPRVLQVLEQAGLQAMAEVYTELETAIGSFWA